jgi:small-conductance mechanosensitive channel
MDLAGKDLIDLFGGRSGQLGTTFVIVSAWALLDRGSRLLFQHGADRSGLFRRQARTAGRIVRIISTVVALSALFVVWGIRIDGVLVFATSIVTLTGVALFAQWSLLSNVTAYFVLLVQDGFRRGNFVRIVELDNYVEGTISDIGPFHTRLVTDDRVVVLVPNNALLARVVMINPRQRFTGAGKLPPTTTQTTRSEESPSQP